MIREVNYNDLDGLLKLYMQLHDNDFPEVSSSLIKLWDKIINDADHHIIAVFENGTIVSCCVCIIIPNLTHSQRPYALIENVITDKDHRKKGLASECLSFAKDIAIKENCYKIMLLTGAKDERTLKFYEKNGFNSHDKTAFIEWL